MWLLYSVSYKHMSRLIKCYLQQLKSLRAVISIIRVTIIIIRSSYKLKENKKGNKAMVWEAENQKEVIFGRERPSSRILGRERTKTLLSACQLFSTTLFDYSISGGTSLLQSLSSVTSGPSLIIQLSLIKHVNDIIIEAARFRQSMIFFSNKLFPSQISTIVSSFQHVFKFSAVSAFWRVQNFLCHHSLLTNGHFRLISVMCCKFTVCHQLLLFPIGVFLSAIQSRFNQWRLLGLG